jgi:hypothetical protein
LSLSRRQDEAAKKELLENEDSRLHPDSIAAVSTELFIKFESG